MSVSLLAGRLDQNLGISASTSGTTDPPAIPHLLGEVVQHTLGELALPICNELVSESSNGKQIAGLRGLGLNITAQAHNKVVYGPRIGIFVQIPDILENRLSGHGMSQIAHQVAEQVRLHHGQLHDVAAHTQLKILKVDDLVVEAENVRGIHTLPRGGMRDV